MSNHHRDNGPNAPRFFEIFASWSTGGMYDIVKWFWAMTIDSATMLLLVFVKKNAGYKITKNSEWIYTSFLIAILIVVSLCNATPDDSTVSARLLMNHWIAFMIMSSWRKLGAWLSLRGMFPNIITPRMSNGIGTSVIYPLIRFILKPIGLVDSEQNPKTFWKMTHDRWVQFWEPILCLATGYYILMLGYEVYGQLIMLCSVCVWMMTFRAYNNTAKVEQAQRDAKDIGEIVRPKENEEDKQPHVIQ